MRLLHSSGVLCVQNKKFFQGIQKMESYGGILKDKREEKGLDFETISRETSITSSYLRALEEENASAFPGEPYLVGFLRNYAEYLGLDSQRLIQLYHAKTLQESPVPDGLIVRSRPKFLVPLICVLVLLFVAGGTVLAVWLVKKNSEKNATLASLEKDFQSKKYELTEKTLAGRFYKGDQFVLTTGSGEVILTVANTINDMGLETPVGVQHIELSEELEIDVDGDSKPELIAYVSDVSTEKNDRGVEARIMLKNAANVAVGETKASEIPSIEDLPQNQKRTVILEDVRAYPFSVRADFRAGCLFRYRLDRKDAVEDYLSNGDTVNMTASNGVRLWISNGNTVKLQVIAASKTIDLGVTKPGEVIVQDIRWIKDTDGKYKLVVNEID